MVHLRDSSRFRALRSYLCDVKCCQCSRTCFGQPIFEMGYCPGSRRKGSLSLDPFRKATCPGHLSWL